MGRDGQGFAEGAACASCGLMYRGSDDAISRMSSQEGDHIVDHAGIQQFHPFGRLIGIVRRQHHLLAGQQGMIRGYRLVVKYIDAGATEVARVQGLDQSLTVDDGTTGRVDEQRAMLHPTDLLRPDEATTFAGQLDV